MEYLKKNKKMLLKYLAIIVTNILTYIFVNFYFRNYEHNYLIMFVLIAIFGELINIYKGKVKFEWPYDLMTCVIIGIILSFFIKKDLTYATIILALFIPNNFVFYRSRKTEKILKNLLQSLSILLIVILSMFICLFIRLR